MYFNVQSSQILLIFSYPLFCRILLLQDKLVFNASENFSTTQSTLPEDFPVNQDFPFNLLQDLRSHNNNGREILNDLFTSEDLISSQDLEPNLISSADPLFSSEDLPPYLFPSLRDSTFLPEGGFTESDIM